MSTEPTKTITIRIPPTIELAMNASRPWRRAGFASRNAWLVSLIADALDMRSVPKQERFDRTTVEVAAQRNSRRGQL